MAVGIFDKVDTGAFVAMLSRAKRRFGFVVMMFQYQVCILKVYDDGGLGKW